VSPATGRRYPALVPELPDILLYLHALEPRVVGRRIDAIELGSPFLLRSVEPRLDAVTGRTVEGLRRLGKRIVFGLEGGLFLVVHLMIAGRFKWSEKTPPVVRKRSARPSALLTIRFAQGTLTLTEAGTVHRASLYVVDGAEALAAHDPGGLEVLDSDAAAFDAALKGANHTLKRALTDPHLFSGIGNAYSDEILHAAQLSPFRMSGSLTADESRRLYEATCATLRQWIDRLREQAAGEAIAPIAQVEIICEVRDAGCTIEAAELAHIIMPAGHIDSDQFFHIGADRPGAETTRKGADLEIITCFHVDA
jgi:formamidopyrimidine-DNA glycosylase